MLVREIYKDNEEINISTYLSKYGVKDITDFLNPTDKYIENPMLYHNMREAVNLFKYHYLKKSKTYILYDADVDGYTSGTIIYQYMKMLNSDWDIKILLHDGKERGLADDKILNKIIEEQPDFLIIPDAGTNNKLEVSKISENTDVLIIDHHDIVEPVENGIIISNQFDNNVDRDGSGCLVTHTFLRALDIEFDINYSNAFIDMVAFSIISDSMNVTSNQNRTYLEYGILNRNMIQNPFLLLLFDTFIGGENYNQHQISFNIVPKINSCIRTNNIELKQRVCLAFIGQDNLSEVAQLCLDAHKKQRETVEKVIQHNKDNIDYNSNIILLIDPSIPATYSGLIAGELSKGKPAIVGKIKNGVMLGSLRSPFPFRSELNNNELVEWANGHEYACGICIKEENLSELIKYYNDFPFVYTEEIDVLKSYTIKSIPKNLFGEFYQYGKLWGKGLPNPLFHITNIIFEPKDVQILGSNKRTLKIHNSDIDIMIFNCTKQNKIDLGLGYYENDVFVHEPKNGKFIMQCIGELSTNEWKGNKKSQIIVDKFEIMCYNKPILTVSDIF